MSLSQTQNKTDFSSWNHRTREMLKPGTYPVKTPYYDTVNLGKNTPLFWWESNAQRIHGTTGAPLR